MTKWLIRTHTNHLLGPVSKAKLQELIALRSLGTRDEVCSGNGYWFNLEESDLVDRYINGEEKQPFNPLSEHHVEDTQTGFFNLNNLKSPVATGTVNPTQPPMQLTAENPLENLFAPEEKRTGVKAPRPTEVDQQSSLEQNEETQKASLLDTKTLLLIVIIILGASGFLLKDKILEFKQDLNFFNKTSSLQVFSSAYAQSTIQKDELRLKKK